MTNDVTPSLSLAIARLETAADHFALWVKKAPIPEGYAHHDCQWTTGLTSEWMAWQEMFCLQKTPPLPQLSLLEENPPPPIVFLGEGGSHSSQLMQRLGISLWRWLFQGAIAPSFAQSQGIAMGQNQPLRVRLEIRDPDLILLPWEIMQPEAGRQSIAINPQILFSRTSSNVDPLPPQTLNNTLKILLVLGENRVKVPRNRPFNATIPPDGESFGSDRLQLETEAANLVKGIAGDEISALSPASSVAVQVDPLIQPTALELTHALDTGHYNAFFYAGHGRSAPNGGLLFLRPDGVMNGTELAQVLVRNRVTLAVFNACWGAHPAEMMTRSSLAEVLIHHGVPAVLAMRDAIADPEALSFIQVFTRSLSQRLSIDHAVRIARQQLLTVYHYNQPAWTLPILYLHPEFDGRLLKSLDDGITELPSVPLDLDSEIIPHAYFRAIDQPEQIWRIYGGLMRVGRHIENDFTIPEKWVSQHHSRIVCRKLDDLGQYQYFLQDFSRFGTFIYQDGIWQKIHHQETPLQSGLQIRFGSSQGQILEFVIESE